MARQEHKPVVKQWSFLAPDETIWGEEMSREEAEELLTYLRETNGDDLYSGYYIEDIA